jgi:hypothetical protein
MKLVISVPHTSKENDGGGDPLLEFQMDQMLEF